MCDIIVMQYFKFRYSYTCMTVHIYYCDIIVDNRLVVV